MLEIVLPATEDYNEATNEFAMYPEYKIELEHSLFSLSKWESKWEKPFLNDDARTDEQTVDYIRCMTITPNVPEEAYSRFSNADFERVRDYIQASMTATWFNDKNSKPSREIITAEVIYYWMIQSQVPFECEHWHLNRLITLLKVCSAKNAPAKKMSHAERAAQQRAINEANRKKYNTSG